VAAIDGVSASVFVVPTDANEADGTFAWKETTMVLAEARAGGVTGIGWTYAAKAAADLIAGPLARAVRGLDPMRTGAAYAAMNHALRNIGRPGLGWEAVSALDIAIWDAKAKLLGLPLANLLGRVHESVAAYGSGGFTSYDMATLTKQLGGWAEAGFSAVKMKVGTEPASDVERVRQARDAIGPDVALFVDATGAYDRKRALRFASQFDRYGVTWFEEPVSSEDLAGLRLLRDRAPMEISAGEYGYVLDDLQRMLHADCIDVLQADGTRCGGVSGLLAVDALCAAYHVPLSTHCAPHLHAQVGSALQSLRHVEYFHDHARLEGMLFEGVAAPRGGRLAPAEGPGLGVSLAKAASRYRVD
jgi:L-alanine-DL-glutamate epimerase-like enolase superfamily enzyme